MRPQESGAGSLLTASLLLRESELACGFAPSSLAVMALCHPGEVDGAFRQGLEQGEPQSLLDEQPLARSILITVL